MKHFTHPGCKAKQELLAEKPPLLARYSGSPRPGEAGLCGPAVTPAGFVSRRRRRGWIPHHLPAARQGGPGRSATRGRAARPHTHPGKALGNAGEPRARSSPYGTHTNGLARSAGPGPGRRLRVRPAAAASSPPPRRFIPPGAAGRAPPARVPPPAATGAGRSPPSRSRAGAGRPAVTASPLAPSSRPA